MAGLGAKKFPSFSKLSSNDVNGYLASQVIMRFATTAARDAAFGGAGEFTLAEGMTCYIDADNSVMVYDGSNWVEIASALGKAPRGILAYSESVTNQNITTTEALAFTLSFTAVANRYYRLTHYEPVLQVPSGTGTTTEARMRLTSLVGTEISFSQAQNNATNQYAPGYTFSRVRAFPAGLTTVVATLKTSAGTASAFRFGNAYGYFMVEDLGAIA